MESAEPFVNAPRVADHLTTPLSFVYLAVQDKGLPVHRVGRYFRFKLSEVDAWARKGPLTGLAPAKRPVSRRAKGRAGR